MAPLNAAALILVILSAALTLVETVNLRVFLKKGRRAPRLERCPRVSIVKALKGEEARLLENLGSFCEIDYPDYELVLAVASPDDPVLPLVRRFMDRPHRNGLRLVVDTAESGLNPQSNNLDNGAKAANGEIIIFTDSDTRASPDFIRRLIEPLQDGRVGLSSGLAVFRPARGFWSLAKSLTYNTSVPLYNALWCRFLPVTVGAAMAIRREVFEAIGRFEPIANRLTTDQELGKLVARHGFGVRLVPLLIAMDEDDKPFRDHAEQIVRWMIAIKAASPIGYHFIPLANTAFLGAVFWLMAPLDLFHVAVLAMAAFFRMLTPLLLNRPLVEDDRIARHAWMVLPVDLVFVALWLVGQWRRRLTWRGGEFSVAGGEMVPAKSASDEGPVPA
jgi:ceramide glucosyltransferase